MVKNTKVGRPKGSRNRGYFYRKGRGWFAKVGSLFVPLTDECGERLRSNRTPASEVQSAYRRWLSQRDASQRERLQPEETCLSVLEVCTAYLAKVKADGATKTHTDRADTLFDFCFGLPPEFRQKEGKATVRKATTGDKIHDGYGGLPVAELKPIHLDEWIAAHPTWRGGRRSRIQAIKRALNYGVEAGLLSKNPIRGYRTPRSVGRVTYITPEQEEACYRHASHALSLAIKVCIRTGARPGCEFAALTAAHVKDLGDRMEWVLQAHEAKTKRLRVIRVKDPEVLEITRRQIAACPTGPIFRCTDGKAWTRQNLSQRFRFLKYRLAKLGVEFDRDSCIYSCRHTYAKRTLQGYWTGKATNIETLARLMGNSPQVCRDHYLQWCESYNEPLWDAC